VNSVSGNSKNVPNKQEENEVLDHNTLFGICVCSLSLGFFEVKHLDNFGVSHEHANSTSFSVKNQRSEGVVLVLGAVELKFVTYIFKVHLLATVVNSEQNHQIETGRGEKCEHTSLYNLAAVTSNDLPSHLVHRSIYVDKEGTQETANCPHNNGSG
jgi:hypothetical protein